MLAMKSFSGIDKSTIVSRYRSNYKIRAEISITYEMVLFHWNLERELTKRILESAQDERWFVTEKCYTQLYESIPWVQEVEPAPAGSLEQRYALWSKLLCPAPKRIYEIGSGQGELIRYLASIGHFCKGTEITCERGEKWTPTHQHLQWGNTDGVHLSDFETEETYDCVISDQVVEHIHPDDIQTHFHHAYRILKQGGCYIFATPHRYFGPADISRIFDSEIAQGMHLREYTFCELYKIMRKAGFFRVYLPGRPLFKMCSLERLFDLASCRKKQRNKILENLRFPHRIFMIGKKTRQVDLPGRMMDKFLHIRLHADG